MKTISLKIFAMCLVVMFYLNNIYPSPNTGVLQVHVKVAEEIFLPADKFTLLFAETSEVVLFKVVHHRWVDRESLEHFV